jgi:hypothetical protein
MEIRINKKRILFLKINKIINKFAIKKEKLLEH